MTSTAPSKSALRQQVWSRLEAVGVVPPGVTGRIPDFDGAERAAELLAALDVWQTAEVIKAVPDRPLLPVRIRALEDGKLVYMAAPKLATERPFYKLDPAALSMPPQEAAIREVIEAIAPTVDVSEMPYIDLVVVGSVAVNAQGARLGKGAGYADLEVALLIEAGLISERTVIATTVHELQVLDEDFPELPHDFRVDLIVTPERVIWCGQPKRPAGIEWGLLTVEQTTKIPVLARRAR